jgi:hypothetical protein
VLDFVIPGGKSPRRVLDLVHPATGNRVTWQDAGRWPDPARQLIVEEATATEFDAAGVVLRTETECLILRCSLRSEMRLLFELAGLKVVADYGDFDGGSPSYGREQVWVLATARG